MNTLVNIVLSFVVFMISTVFNFINAFRSAFIIGGLALLVIFSFTPPAHAGIFEAPPVVTCEVPPTEHSGAYVREMVDICTPSQLAAYDAVFPVSEWTLLPAEKKVSVFLLFFVIILSVYFIYADNKEKKAYRNKYTT